MFGFDLIAKYRRNVMCKVFLLSLNIQDGGSVNNNEVPLITGRVWEFQHPRQQIILSGHEEKMFK